MLASPLDWTSTGNMFKYIVLLGIMVASVYCQGRPPYAGTSNRYPVVLPQYVNENPQTTQAALANRIDESVSPVLSPSTTKNNIDETQMDWIKTWDQEKQPFWYLNWKHIQEHIGAIPPIPAINSEKPIRRL